MKTAIATKGLRGALGALLVASLIGGLSVPARALSPSQTKVPGVARVMMPLLNEYWSKKLGNKYRAPQVFGYTTRVKTPCGRAVLGNSFYCPKNESIYLDMRWHNKLIREIGDYASALILAHEWGHHIQKILKWPYRKLRGQKFELQADCFAGMATYYAKKIGRLAFGDLREANYLLARSGSRSHGSGFWRKASFQDGLLLHDMFFCK